MGLLELVEALRPVANVLIGRVQPQELFVVDLARGYQALAQPQACQCGRGFVQLLPHDVANCIQDCQLLP